MVELVMHVGHGKTGSSYIQSVLSQNYDQLYEAGIFYPPHGSFEAAKRGRITSGNGTILFHKINLTGESKILVSSELLFSPKLYEVIASSEVNFQKITVILYTRNVMEFLVSQWGQHVKRHGNSQSLGEYLIKNHESVSEHTSHHALVIKLIEMCREYGFEIHVRNYSNHKKDLIADFMSTTLQSFSMPPDAVSLNVKSFNVNRSLTHVECSLIRQLNRLSAKAGRKLSDFLVNSFPNVKPRSPTVQRSLFDSLKLKHLEVLEKINDFVEEDEQVLFGHEDEFELV